MSLEDLGTIGLIISVIATTTFVLGYAILAPWYRSAIGISLMASKAWLAGISWLASLGYVFGTDRDSIPYLALRAGLWISLPVVSVMTLYALLIRSQVRSHRRRVRKSVPREGAK